MAQTRPEVRCKFYSLEEYHKRRFPQDSNARIRRLYRTIFAGFVIIGLLLVRRAWVAK